MGSTGYNQTCVYHLLIVCKLFFKIVFRFEVDTVTQIFGIHGLGAADFLFEIQVGVSERFFQELFRLIII